MWILHFFFSFFFFLILFLLSLISNKKIIRKCLSLQGTHNYGPRHLEQAIEFLANNQEEFPFASLTSPAYSLDNLNEAIEIAFEQKWPRVSIFPNKTKN